MRRWAVVLAVIVLYLHFCQSAVMGKDMWAEHAVGAKHAWNDGHYEEAEKLYELALKDAEALGEDDPRLTASLRATADFLDQHTNKLERGEMLLRREQKILQRLGPDFPGLITGMNLLGRVLYQEKKYDQCARTYEGALKICPEGGGGAFNEDKRSELLEGLGRCYEAMGQYDAAERCFMTQLKRVAAKGGGLFSRYRNLGQVDALMGKYDQSLFWFNHCLEAAKSDANGYLSAEVCTQIGDVYRSMKKEKEGLKYFRQALEFAGKDETCQPLVLAALYPRIAQIERTAGNEAGSQAAAKEALKIAQKRGETTTVASIRKFLGAKE